MKRLRTIFRGAFLASDIAGGVVMMLAAALALIAANSPLSQLYHHFTHATLMGSITVHYFIQDMLMAIFFLMVGLELKYEMLTRGRNEAQRLNEPMFVLYFDDERLSTLTSDLHDFARAMPLAMELMVHFSKP